MSKNFFGVLDDSDDEGQKQKVAPAKAEKKDKPKKVAPVAEPSKTDNRRRGQQGHGDRNTKQGRGGRPPARDGKRTYDRRSGTGRGREIKKGGGGARNWGSDKNDAKKAEGAVTEGQEGAALETMPEVEEEPKDEPEKSEDAPAEEEGAEEKVEEKEEDKTMTYDEYMASKQTPDSEAFKALAVKEVENEFSGVSARARDEEAFLVMGGGKAPRKKGGKKKEKETLVPSFRVADSNSGERRGRDRRDGDRRGGRGGRGNRERGGRYGNFAGRGGQRSKNIDVSDADAFPSL